MEQVDTNYITAQGPLISVIIPVYNVQNYLKRCLDSLLAQTYQNLEIILVDDCSADDSAKIIDRYGKADSRVKTVRHAENRGLFQARLTGYELASGKYIAFVDADDYISVDWFRKLLRKAEATGADITVGEWCYDHAGQDRDYCNLDHFRLNDYCLEGAQIMDTFMAAQGRNFSWTVLWNKLYTKALWEECYPEFVAFSSAHGHMLMWEDIAFSSMLWAHARRAVNTHAVNYFYYKHEGAATHNIKNRKRNLKYIRDASAAIAFMENVLAQRGLLEKYRADFDGWKTWGMSILYKDLVIDLKENQYKKAIFRAFHCTERDYAEPETFFYSLTTPLHASFDELESIKKSIASDTIRYVSFDVFDTLIQRPFFCPTDLFELLSERFNEGLSSYVNFRYIRESAEQAVRRELAPRRSSREDITLDEIYDYILTHYRFDGEKINALKQYELALELRYCMVRRAGKDLFDLALECGKKVVICSDMYLPKESIAGILEHCGIRGYEKLYVSSDVGLTKARKSLYSYILRDLGCKSPSFFLHIGDNRQSDVENARACGCKSRHIPRAAELLLNENPDIYSGEAFHKLYRNALFKADYRQSFDDFCAVRTVAAMAANKIFDDPFVSFHPDSDFNADPRLIGYAVLGPHLLALCQWLHKEAETRKIGTIHFAARDGYLVRQAYTLCYPDARTSYLRLLRKALLLADIDGVEDLYSLCSKIHSAVSPRVLVKYLAPIIPQERRDGLPALFDRAGLRFNRALKDSEEWARCIQLLIDHAIDLSLLPAYKAGLRAYFAGIIKPGDYLFDVGYSGRPESALSGILGFPVGSLYIHVNNELAALRQEKYACPTAVFYQYKPSITGVIREHMLMELAPSTVGYLDVNGKLEPELEPYEEAYCCSYVTRLIQEHALAFIRDYKALFGESGVMHAFQSEVLSAPYEYYLHYSKPVDRQLFSSVPFEDDFGLGKLNALSHWNKELSTRDLGGAAAENTVSAIAGDVIPGLYVDGYLVKFIHAVNKLFPRGGSMREVLKTIARLIDNTANTFTRSDD